jgi:hypothetical protein
MDHDSERRESIHWDPNHPVDQAFARWVGGIRPVISANHEIRDLIGAMQGVSLLVHMCEGSTNDEFVDDALVSLHELCSSVVGVEEFVVLGGLQVRKKDLVEFSLTPFI